MAKKKTRRGGDIPLNETKADRFKRVVTPRVSKAMKAIQVVGFCAGATYEYTATQTEKIIDSLTREIDKLRNKFEAKEENKALFNLDD